jgi:hypothetical protein
MAVNVMNYFAPLDILGASQFQSAFKTDQLQALALASLRSYGRGYDIALVFFGVHCLLIGYLIFRSIFLPRIFGLVMVLAGIGWLTFLWQPLANHLYRTSSSPALLGKACSHCGCS